LKHTRRKTFPRTKNLYQVGLPLIQNSRLEDMNQASKEVHEVGEHCTKEQE
jgi:hypothetical protein